MTIQEIHDLVWTHLLEKKEICFSLRNQDKRNESALRKGHWFLGTDDTLYLSFWDSNDWINKTPNIFFACKNEVCWLEFVGKEGGEKANFLEEMSRVLGLRKKHTKQEHKWIKQYSYDESAFTVEQALNIFLATDKKIIDALIISNNKKHLFPHIDHKTFDANLAYIRGLQDQWHESGIPTSEKDAPKIQEALRLKKITLKNISHFNYIELNLNESITCIIGENGSGKTSILKAIALGLVGVSNNNVINLENDTLRKMLRIQRIENEEAIYTPNGRIAIFYNKYKNYINFEHQKGGNANIRGLISTPFNQIDDVGSDLKATDDLYFKNLVLGFSQMKNHAEGKTIVGDVKPRLSEVANLIYNLPDQAFDNLLAWIIQLHSSSLSSAKRRVRLQVLIDIFAVIQRIVGGTFELVPLNIDQDTIFIKTTDAPDGVPLKLISQGYHNVIGWVGHFMQRLWEVTPESEKVNFKKTPAICLIDEVDTYLHPKWEQKILAVLAEEFPNTQFVVTTHSPIVLANLKGNYRIYTIAKADNGQMMAFEHPKSGFNPYGASSSEVIRRLMHVQERPEPVQKLLNAYNQAIIHNDFAKATDFEAQLKQLIDPNDPEIIEGQASIEARKIIQDL